MVLPANLWVNKWKKSILLRNFNFQGLRFSITPKGWNIIARGNVPGLRYYFYIQAPTGWNKTVIRFYQSQTYRSSYSIEYLFKQTIYSSIIFEFKWSINFAPLGLLIYCVIPHPGVLPLANILCPFGAYLLRSLFIFDFNLTNNIAFEFECALAILVIWL